MLFKLQQLGIEGQPVDWVSNYLIDRRQRVFIGQSQSQCKTITSGTCDPGFSFGPLLFLTFVNDITDNLLSITRLFTYDTFLATTTTNVEEMQGILNHKLSEMVKTIAGYI